MVKAWIIMHAQVTRSEEYDLLGLWYMDAE